MGFTTHFVSGILEEPFALVNVFRCAEVPEDLATRECRRLPRQYFAGSVEPDDASFRVGHDDEAIGRIQHRLYEIALPFEIRLLFFQLSINVLQKQRTLSQL